MAKFPASMTRRGPVGDVALMWDGRRCDARAPWRSAAPARLERLERIPASALPSRPLSAGEAPNRLLLGDNLTVLAHLHDELAGRVDLAVVDLPFASGTDYRAPLRLGVDAGGRGAGSIVAFRDTWEGGLPGYLTMLEPRLRLLHALLGERGSLYVHVDQRASAVVRLLLEEIFGPGGFVNELVWAYRTGGTSARLGFARKHDTILFFVKDPARAIWNPPRERSRLSHHYGFKNVEILTDAEGPYTWVRGRDVLDVPALRGNQPERVDYPTQKPEALLERFILASSEPHSLVLDAFAGSGTALVVAERHGRRWVGCDQSPVAVAAARKRLLSLTTRAEFEVIAAHEAVGSPFPTERPQVSARALVEGETVRVELTGLGYQRPSQLPAGVRFEPPAFADFVDAWAVGWDGSDGVPRADWSAQRSRAVRALPLVSAPHRYPCPGRYELRVTVYDVFGGHGAASVTVQTPVA